MRKLVLSVAVMSMFASGMLWAQQPEKEAKKCVVYDGDKVGEGAKGWSSPAEKTTVAAQDKVVRTAGKKTVEFHAKGKEEWMGCGWNWFGWYPADEGTDVSQYKNLRFWAKLTGKKPGMLSAALVANEPDKDKKASEACSLYKYCADLADGKWHEIVIPINDLYVKKDVNRTKVWEIMLGCWVAGRGRLQPLRG